MKNLIEITWNLLKEPSKEIEKKYPGLLIDKDAKKLYAEYFEKYYNLIRHNYMKDRVENLDRHKVASIMIVSMIKAEVIKYNGELHEDEKFFGQYLIIATLGISYMQDKLNKLLINKGKEPISTLWLPTAISCDTLYFEILCRNLYFSNNNSEWGLNPLDLAEKLFIFEYVTLEKKKIDPSILKDGTTL
jgi:hypothetical protein